MTEAKKPGRLRWRRVARENGLRAMVQGIRGSEYHDGVNVYARTQKLPGRGWIWYGGIGNASHNSCENPVSTETEAKASAEKFIANAAKGGAHAL